MTGNARVACALRRGPGNHRLRGVGRANARRARGPPRRASRSRSPAQIGAMRMAADAGRSVGGSRHRSSFGVDDDASVRGSARASAWSRIPMPRISTVPKQGRSAGIGLAALRLTLAACCGKSGNGFPKEHAQRRQKRSAIRLNAIGTRSRERAVLTFRCARAHWASWSAARVGAAVGLSVMTFGHNLDRGACPRRQHRRLCRKLELILLRYAMGTGRRSVCQACAATSRRGGKGARDAARSPVGRPLPTRHQARPLRRCPISLFHARLRIRHRRVLIGLSPWLRRTCASRS